MPEQKENLDIILDEVFTCVFAGFSKNQIDEYLKEVLSEKLYLEYLDNKEDIMNIINL